MHDLIDNKLKNKSLLKTATAGITAVEVQLTNTDDKVEASGA